MPLGHLSAENSKISVMYDVIYTEARVNSNFISS